MDNIPSGGYAIEYKERVHTHAHGTVLRALLWNQDRTEGRYVKGVTEAEFAADVVRAKAALQLPKRNTHG